MDPDLKLLFLILLGAGLAGALWFYKDDVFQPAEAPAVIVPDLIAEEPPARSGPVYPVTTVDVSPSPDGKLVALPPLDDSDSYFLLALIDSFGPTVGDVLVNEALIDKFVATVDNLSRDHVAEKLRPVGRLQGAFDVDVVGSDSQLILSSANYERYSGLVNLVASADLEVVAATYRRFYPLFQESYVRLGYPNGYFNDRVVEVIDHLLQTPEPAEPVRLVRPHVLYEFSDSGLQASSSGQKLLLRMGRENSTRIKQALKSLRAMVTEPTG